MSLRLQKYAAFARASSLASCVCAAVGASVALDASCDPGVQPARPDSSFGDADIRRGCPNWASPLAQPGDRIADDWESFAEGFFDSYCNRCHSSALEGSGPRNGAKAGYNWDDLAIVREHLEEIRDAVGERNYMPPNNPKPTCDLRRRVVRWIDAGAP
jgi:hypothetical protein